MFFKLLIQRYQSESPDFFRKMIKWGIILGAILSGYKMLLQFDIIPSEGIWLKLSNLFNFIIGGLGGIVLTGSATTTDANLMDVKTKVNVVEAAIEDPGKIVAEPPADETTEKSSTSI